MSAEDALWGDFKPLWIDLQSVSGLVLLAGGYGLFLKQNWLTSNRHVPTVVPLDRWIDVTPRVTKDLDLIVGFQLIAQQDLNESLAAALVKNGFAVSERHPRWQFTKPRGSEREILVEFHAPLPPIDEARLKLDRIRIKHKPSLGELGIHGRQNAEAIGGDHHPFRFEYEGTSILVPNPVTWSVMKLAAMRDSWNSANDPDRTPEKRDFFLERAIKHAKDVFRVVAMMNVAERDNCSIVLSALGSAEPLIDAGQVFLKFFASDGGTGTRFVAQSWHPDDARLIREVLAEWFA